VRPLYPHWRREQEGDAVLYLGRLRTLISIVLALALTACGGGGGGGGNPAVQAVSGGGVKGPLANADASAKAFDSTAANLQGAEVAVGTTNSAAALVGLALPLPLAPPYILEFTSNAGTTDITTGQAPVIGTLRTVITQEMLDAGTDVYGTLETTMATDLAVANADSPTPPYGGNGDGTVTEAEFLAALPVAAAQVASTFGFGLTAGVDLFTTPPLLIDDTDTVAEQSAVAAYRTGLEALTAVLVNAANNAGVSVEALFAEVTADLADGTIDGTVGGVASVLIDAGVLSDLTMPPGSLQIPNTTMTVADTQALLASETSTTGAGVDTTALTDGTITTSPQAAETDSDRDDDGHPNTADNCPDNTNTDQADTDGDSAGDACDACPNDAANDADGDGVCGDVDVCPNDANNDADGDGVCGDVDVCPGFDDNADADGDGTPDGCDMCPDDADNDSDGDGVCIGAGFVTPAIGGNDNCPNTSNTGQTDSDADGVGDACDTCPNDVDNDADGDGVCGDVDVCPGFDDNADADSDGTPDGCDMCPGDPTDDLDADGICAGTGFAAPATGDGDNCPNTANADQADADADGAGDACDLCPDDADNDADGDGICVGAGFLAPAIGGNDNCPDTSNTAQTDSDVDGAGDACDVCPNDATDSCMVDTDGDGILDPSDICPLDTDNDSDGDGVCVGADFNPPATAGSDNCPNVANADQADSNANGVGDACEGGATVPTTGQFKQVQVGDWWAYDNVDTEEYNLITDRTVTGPASQTARVSVTLERDTLGNISEDAYYITQEVDGTVHELGGAFEGWYNLPLEETVYFPGFVSTGTSWTLSYPENGGFSDETYTVGPKEVVQVLAGSFEAFRVAFTGGSRDGSGNTSPWSGTGTYWLSPAIGAVVKWEATFQSGSASVDLSSELTAYGNDTASDLDADGVPDVTDTCVATSNAANQADSDGDGLGDACDFDSGGGGVVVTGSYMLSGTDTGVFGTTFTPEGGTIQGTSFVAFAAYVRTGPGMPMTAGGVFSADGTPVGVSFIVGTDSPRYAYTAACSLGADCSGVSLDLDTGSLTFSGQVLPPDANEDNNLATANLTLTGTVTVTVP
jgi:hypothetical protein